MSTIDEINSMRQSGRTDSEIISFLSDRGLSRNEIAESMAQAKIKSAVEGETEGIKNTFPQQDSTYGTNMENNKEGYEGMQQSIMNQPVEQPEEYAPAPSQPQDYQAQQQYAPQDYQQQQYQQYQPQSSVSADTITEITDQILSEKMQSMRSQVEKLLDMKNTMESKIDYMDERLKRIEKVIDSLQSSVLQKVGQYVNNIDDMKTELQETQKSFKSLLQTRHPSSSDKKEK
jgi:hypothetical protein